MKIENKCVLLLKKLILFLARHFIGQVKMLFKRQESRDSNARPLFWVRYVTFGFRAVLDQRRWRSDNREG